MRRLSLVGLLSTVTLAAFAVACRDDLKSPAEPANPANPVNPALKAVAGPLPPPTLPFRPDHQGSLPGAAHFNRVSRPGGANFSMTGSSTSTIMVDGASSTSSVSINDAGQVTGYAYNDAAGGYHAFVWSSSTGGADLGGLSGADFSFGQAINAHGDVAGFVDGAYRHAFLAPSKATMQDLGVLAPSGWSVAYGLNDAGQVVGSALTANESQHAFLWSASTGMVDITPQAAGAGAVGISKEGVVSGAFVADDGQWHPYQRTSAGAFTDLGTFGGVWAYPVASNAQGQVTGYLFDGTTYIGFLYTPGSAVQTFGTWSETIPEAIDGKGDVVGFMYDLTSGVAHTFIWNAKDGLQDLDPLTQLPNLVGVNDNLQAIYSDNLITLSDHVNKPPVGNNGSVETVTNTPVGVTLAGSDPDNDPLTYAVATPPHHGSLSGTAPDLMYVPATGYEGDDWFTFTVTDAQGAVAQATVSIIVKPANHPPVAVAGGNDATRSSYVGVEGSAVAFDGSASSDADHDVLAYVWEFGDGSPASTASPTATASHVYADNGTFTAKLTVTDIHGAIASQAVSVVVSNVSPTGTLGAPATVNEGDNFTLAMSNAHDASAVDQQSLQFAYDCGNGFSAPTAAASVQCPAVDNGTLVVHAKVMDKDGGVTPYEAKVTVQNVRPTVLAGSAATITSGDTYTLHGSFADRGVNDAPWAYVVNWGGVSTSGSIATQGAITASHRYLTAGTYTVTLNVTDKDNGGGSATTTVTVLRLPVGLAIKPGNGNKAINLNDHSNATVGFAILSSSSFDAHLVDAGSARIGNAAVATKKGAFLTSFEDVNGDGRSDLVLQFGLSDLISAGGLSLSSTSLTVLANLTDGRQISATDVLTLK
jgi:probable HAF family extracellular repeat protein